jgi:AbrB family looped-hinge helix DNA binding protein
MLYNIKITSKGQITLPKEIRDQLTLRMGDYLQAEITNDKIILKPLPIENDISLLLEYAGREGRNSIGLEKVRELTNNLPVSMVEWVRETREAEANE